MQGADAVGVPRQFERQHGHAERLVGVARINPSQPHEVVVRQVEGLADLAQVLFDERGREPVVAGGHGRMGRENRHRRDVAHDLAKRQAGGLHQRADHFQRRERAMPLVEMQDGGVNLERMKCPQAADAQKQLLANPDARVSAIKPGGQRPIRLGVLRNVRVEKQQHRPPDLDSPDPRVQRAGCRLDLDQEGLAVGTRDALDGEQVGVGVQVKFLLPAVGVERLAKIALRIEEPDADQRDAEVAGALQVVAGQHAQAARVDR